MYSSSGAQRQFFTVTIALNDQRQWTREAPQPLDASRPRFRPALRSPDRLSFLDAHVRAFALFGGVPRRMVYDDLSVPVQRVQLPRRQLIERFTALPSYCAFGPSFARPGQGHDKGGVESRDHGLRLPVLTPVTRGDLLDQLSKWIQAKIEQLALELVAERFAREGSPP